MFFFGNLLTKYMLSNKVPEYPDSDDINPTLMGLLDIIALSDTTKKLSNAAKAERVKTSAATSMAR